MPSDFSLEAIISGDSSQLGQLFQAAAPSAAAQLRLASADQLCQQLFAGEQFDQALAAPLQALRAAIAPSIAAQDDFYCDADHPLRKVLQCLLTHGRSWYPRDSKISQQFYEKLSLLIQASIDYAHKHNSSRLNAEQTETCQWFTREAERAAMLEQRLCDTELGNLKIMGAECRVLDLLNRALAHKQFPQEATAGLVGTLKSELRHNLLTQGSDSDFWKKWQLLLPMIAQVFNEGTQSEQLLYKNIPIILSELELSLALNISQTEAYQLWLSQLSDVLMLRIKQQPVACTTFYALGYPEGYSDITTRVTDSVMQQANNVSMGDWILFSAEDGSLVRCKLALTNADSDQLLFVDSNGRKVMAKSIKDFSICLSTGIAKKLLPIDINRCIVALLQKLLQQAQQQQAERAARQAQAAAEAEQQRLLAQQQAAADKAEQERKIAEENAARRAAAQKALAEARALAEQKAQRAAMQAAADEAERERLAAAEMAEQLQQQQLANQQISALNLGARVELRQHTDVLRCKLAVIIAATGKYIFTDNLGRKVAELQRDQLVQLLLAKQLTLLSNGDNFDDQLVKVIRSLRKDIS